MTPIGQDVNRLMQQLAAAQMAAQAFVMQAEMVLEDMAKALKDVEAPPDTDAAESGCRHPQQFRDTSVRTMGHANRFLCRMCGKTIEGDTP